MMPAKTLIGRGIACDNINRALVCQRSGGWFDVSTSLPLTAGPLVQNHRGLQRTREAIVAVQQIRALVVVAMAREHKIHSMRLQNRHDVLPHFDQLNFIIRIMRTFGVWWVMPEGDKPLIGIGV